MCDTTLCDQVVLCGGTVNSPQLLLLSGIGPADELRRHNIKLQHHSPGVGINLQDQVRVNLHYRCTKPVTFNLNQVYSCAFTEVIYVIMLNQCYL